LLTFGPILSLTNTTSTRLTKDDRGDDERPSSPTLEAEGLTKKEPREAGPIHWIEREDDCTLLSTDARLAERLEPLGDCSGEECQVEQLTPMSAQGVAKVRDELSWRLRQRQLERRQDDRKQRSARNRRRVELSGLSLSRRLFKPEDEAC